MHSTSSYSSQLHVGTANTQDYRCFLQNDEKKKISFWHDVSLIHGKTPKQVTLSDIKEGAIFNFVNEIPRGSTAKLEVATKEDQNPIKQDIKKGKLRHYHTPSTVNYGMLPQTWENPHHADKSTGL